MESHLDVNIVDNLYFQTKFITVTTQIKYMVKKQLSPTVFDFVEPYKGEAWRKGYQAAKQEIQSDIASVLLMFDGNVDRKKIANYIRKYLLT